MTQSPAKITAILTAHPGKAAELRALLVGMAPLCRAEPGNLRWDLWRDESDLETFVIDELYRDEASVQAHRATPHYQNYASKINSLATRTAVTATSVDVAA